LGQDEQNRRGSCDDAGSDQAPEAALVTGKHQE
jgi:hypothetical protein